MGDKKHIDRLFQEKFKDFEAKPNDTVWNAIQDQLEKPVAKSKGLPLWLRLVGVAALVLLIFTIGNSLLGSNAIEGQTETVVDTNSKKAPENVNNHLNTTTTVTSENESVLENTTVTNNALNGKTNPEDSRAVVHSNETKSSYDNTNNTSPGTTGKDTNVHDITLSDTLQNKQYKPSYYTTTEAKVENPLVTNVVKTNPSTKTTTDKNLTASVQSQGVSASRPTSISVTKKKTQNQKPSVINHKSNSPLFAENQATNETYLNSNSVTNSTTNPQDKTNKNFINNKLQPSPSNDAVTQTNSEEEKTNMNPKDEAAQTPNPLEEAALANTEDSIEKEKEETVMNRWTVNANVAPVYYNTLGKGSHIHDQFIDNPKNGEVNTSYGINVGYALNNKLKVRSGISKLNLSYDTANVIVYENVSNTPSSAPLRNINFIPTNTGQNIAVLSASNVSVQQIDGVTNDALNAALSQRLSYVEVPVELEYALINNRVGLHIIGGVSTFILEGNEVVTEVENRKTKIGESNNINNLSFTTNLGLGLDYKFSNTFKFNLEPTFKYHLNAYRETSGNFKPYIIGVYTGFSYKF